MGRDYADSCADYVSNLQKMAQQTRMSPWPVEITVQTTQPTHHELKLKTRVMPCSFVSASACPRALVAKRVYVRIREKEGFKHRWLWRAPCFWGTYA